MTDPPGRNEATSNTGRPADTRVSKAMRHRLASALLDDLGIDRHKYGGD